MSPSIQLQPSELKLLRQILEQHLPKDCKIWLFGSRAKHTAKKHSDIDIALDHSQPISLQTIAILNNALSESNLNNKVDVIDLNQISESFKQNIKNDLVLI